MSVYMYIYMYIHKYKGQVPAWAPFICTCCTPVHTLYIPAYMGLFLTSYVIL